MASPEQADAFHAAGIANGGTTCEDPPGMRNGAVGQLYLAYLRDPDGNTFARCTVLRANLLYFDIYQRFMHKRCRHFLPYIFVYRRQAAFLQYRPCPPFHRPHTSALATGGTRVGAGGIEKHRPHLPTALVRRMAAMLQ